MEIIINTGLQEAEIDFIEKQLIDYNLSIVPTNENPLFQKLNYSIKDIEGNIIAGLLAIKYYWHSAFVDIIWVDEKHRDKKLGSKLLEKLEIDLKALGCKLVHLDTFDFQAPNFYVKNGYTLYGELKDNPKGHSRFYYCKFLD